LLILLSLIIIAIDGELNSAIAATVMSSIEDNMSRGGGDHYDLEDTIADIGPSDCREICREDNRCQSWLYVKGTLTSNPECYLYEEINKPFYLKNAYSGIKIFVHPIYSTMKAIYFEQSRSGLMDVTIQATDVNVCDNECWRRSTCWAWTYTKNVGENYGTCNLKHHNDVLVRGLSSAHTVYSSLKGTRYWSNHKRWLSALNYYRWLHGLSPLKWSDELTEHAKSLASNQCSMNHSLRKGVYHPEDTRETIGEQHTIEENVEGWYNFPGQWTTIMWADEVGCEIKRCMGDYKISVCHYRENRTTNVVGPSSGPKKTIQSSGTSYSLKSS